MSQRKSTLVIYLLKKASHHFITIWSICVCATKLLLFMDPPHMLTCHFSKRAGISIKGYDLACSTRCPYPSHPSVTFTTQICSFLQKSSLEIESNCCARGSAKMHRLELNRIGCRLLSYRDYQYCRSVGLYGQCSKSRIENRKGNDSGCHLRGYNPVE